MIYARRRETDCRNETGGPEGPPRQTPPAAPSNEEGRPAVIEVLCDECETALNFEDFDAALRKEMLLTLGAR